MTVTAEPHVEEVLLANSRGHGFGAAAQSRRSRAFLMIKRMYKRLTGAAIRGWLLVGGLLGVGALPCPECGAPMIFHFWPIAGVALVFQVLKRRYGDKFPAEKGGQEDYVAPVNHIQQT